MVCPLKYVVSKAVVTELELLLKIGGGKNIALVGKQSIGWINCKSN
jgi:hypothetical protein